MSKVGILWIITPLLNKSSKSLLQPTKKKINNDENMLLGKHGLKQFCDKTGKHVNLTKAVGTVTEGISYLETRKQKPASVATVIHVDEQEEKPVEEFGCTHCS